jgi:alginate O-acetyltransferase complex protein AlgI
MVFSSLIFLFLFLPLFLAVYYASPKEWRSPVILIGGCIFYAWWRVDFLLLIMGVTFWNYVIAQRIVGNVDELKRRRWMQIGVAGNLITLGIFKYFNFGIESVNAVLEASGLNTIEALRFILPIGISFHIFQCISFLIDIYRGESKPPKKLRDFLAFMTLFPQLIAGPVLRYKDLEDQFTDRTHTPEKFTEGAYRFMSGFAKKVLIADTVAPLVDKTFALEDPTMADAWLGAMAYTLQLYFDFSGYSDMAIGLGLMMGFRFMENFNHPYISRSITEFWRRWHISLSTWLRDYLYIPLGGNRKGVGRTYINLFLTMLLGGLWHGANWTFIIWGAFHGGILALERFANQTKKGMSLPAMPVLKNVVLLPVTFFLIVMGWVMFRSENVGQALRLYEAMFTGERSGLSEALSWQVTGVATTAMIVGYTLMFTVPLVEKYAGLNLKQTRSVWIHGGAIGLFVLAVIKLGAQSYSPFLYFQF